MNWAKFLKHLSRRGRAPGCFTRQGDLGVYLPGTSLGVPVGVCGRTRKERAGQAMTLIRTEQICVLLHGLLEARKLASEATIPVWVLDIDKVRK